MSAPRFSYGALERVCDGFLLRCLGKVEAPVDIFRMEKRLGIERPPEKPPSMEMRLILGPQDEATKQRAAKRRRQAQRLDAARQCGQRILASWLQAEGTKYQVERCAYLLLMPASLLEPLLRARLGEGPIPIYGDEFFLAQDKKALEEIADILDVPFLDLRRHLDQMGRLNHKPIDDPVYDAAWRKAYQANLEAFLAAQSAPKEAPPPQEGPASAASPKEAKPKRKSPSKRKPQTPEGAPQKPRRTRASQAKPAEPSQAPNPPAPEASAELQAAQAQPHTTE